MQISARTEETEQRYVKRAKNLVMRFEREEKSNISSPGGRFVKWLIGDTKSKSDSNWRQVKASCVFYFGQMNMPALAGEIEAIENDHVVHDSLAKLTSAQKKKSVSIAEEKMIMAAFKRSAGSVRGSYWDKPTLAVFKAGLVVGLRPCEWKSAVLLVEKTTGSPLELPILKVKNGKSTNGRSFGEYRYIGLSTLDKEDLIWIKLALAYCGAPKNKAGESISFEALYDAMRQRIYTVNKYLYPKNVKHVTLYSCRHQFIANLKFNKRSLVEIACIVGHGNDVTATEHYGKARVGRAGVRLPVANPDDLDKINELFRGKNERVVLAAQRK